MPLDAATIHKLLNRETPTNQSGPLRWFDNEMRCACKGCSSPTYCKVNGIPRCMMHALKELNELIVDRDEIAA